MLPVRSPAATGWRPRGAEGEDGKTFSVSTVDSGARTFYNGNFDQPLRAAETTNSASFTTGRVETARHRTIWIEAGPANGPLSVFAHGWPGRKFRIADAHALLRFAVERGRYGQNGRSVTTFQRLDEKVRLRVQAALFRMVHDCVATRLIDEFDPTSEAPGRRIRRSKHQSRT